MKKKGFTLVELLAVIVIFAILVLVVIPNIVSIINDNKKDKYISDAQSLISLSKYKSKLYKYSSIFNVMDNGCKETSARALNFDILIDPDENTYDLDASKVMICNADSKYEYYIKMYSVDANNNITKYITGTEIYSYLKEDDIRADNVNDNEMVYDNDELVLWYDAKNNSGIGYVDNITSWFDLSGNSRDGSLFNGASWNDNNLNFDGVDDYVDIFKDNEVLNQEEGTVTIIFKMMDLGNNYSTVFARGTSSNLANSHIQIARNNDSETELLVSIGDNANSSSVIVDSELNDIIAITLTWDGSNFTVYKDGEVVHNNATNVIPANDSEMMYLGKGLDESTSRMFNGNIYNLRIYNEALSEEQILKNYGLDRIRYGL